LQGFLLGLANGTTCLAFCALALIPFLMHEGQTVRQNLVTLVKFLGGRMGGTWSLACWPGRRAACWRALLATRGC